MKLKKIYLALIFQSFCFAALFAGENLFSRYTHLYLTSTWGIDYLITDEITLHSEKDSPTEKKLSLNDTKNNLRLTLPFADVKLNTGDFKTYTYGISIFSEKYFKNLPITMNFGTIKAAGSIGKLNNPFISEPSSPFSTPSFHTSILSSALSTSQSETSNCNTLFQIGFNSKNFFLQAFRINCWYEQSTTVFSTQLKTKISSKCFLEFSSTGGIFPYSENTRNVWFTSNNPYFHKGEHFCGSTQLSFLSPKFNSTFYVFLYESPFGNYNPTFRSESELKTKPFIFSFSSLINPYEIPLSSSEKNLSPCFQIKTGIQHKYNYFHNKPVFIKTGLNAYTKINNSDSQQTFILGTGFQLSTLLFSVSATAMAKSHFETSFTQFSNTFDNFSFQAKNSWNLSFFVPCFSSKTTIKLKDDFYNINQQFGATFSFTTKPKFLFSTIYSMNYENFALKKWNLNSSIKCVISTKLMTITGKLSIVFFRE